MAVVDFAKTKVCLRIIWEYEYRYTMYDKPALIANRYIIYLNAYIMPTPYREPTNETSVNVAIFSCGCKGRPYTFICLT